jgi:hypothetical protein
VAKQSQFSRDLSVDPSMLFGSLMQLKLRSTLADLADDSDFTQHIGTNTSSKQLVNTGLMSGEQQRSQTATLTQGMLLERDQPRPR